MIKHTFFGIYIVYCLYYMILEENVYIGRVYIYNGRPECRLYTFFLSHKFVRSEVSLNPQNFSFFTISRYEKRFEQSLSGRLK